MKICTQCGIGKDEDEFYFITAAQRLLAHCKSCSNAQSAQYCKLHTAELVQKHRRYRKTLKGFLTRKYHDMRARVLGQNKTHMQYKGLSLLPRRQFYLWALNSKVLKRLWQAYKASGWELKQCPTIDRIDATKGYLLENMRFITYSQNSRLARFAR